VVVPAGPALAPRSPRRDGRRPDADLAALRRAEALATPDTLAGSRTLPVLEALAPLVPGGALQRGATVGVSGTGATTLSLALGAGASAAGSWLGVVGVPALGLAAAAELGVALERLLVVADPPPGTWATVVAALLDAVDLVVACPSGPVSAADVRRLGARARERGAVLCTLGDRWPAPVDVRLTVTGATWAGPTGAGSGRLEARRVEVVGGGRGAAARERRRALWLPGPDGSVAPVPAVAAPVAPAVPADLAEAG
jgi:hypothetical protein